MRLALLGRRLLFRLGRGGTVGLRLFHRRLFRLLFRLRLRRGLRLDGPLLGAEFIRQRLRFWLVLGLRFRLGDRGFLRLCFRFGSRGFLWLCFRLEFGLRLNDRGFLRLGLQLKLQLRLSFRFGLGRDLRLSLRRGRGGLLGEDVEHHALDIAELLLGLVEHLLRGRHTAALLGVILLKRGAQLRRRGVAVVRLALRGARDDLLQAAPGLARRGQRLTVHAAAQRVGLVLRQRRTVVRVKRQTAARHARIQQQAERIHIGRGVERAAPEHLGRHELQLLGRPVLRVRAGGRAKTDRAVCGTADVVRADAAVICPALRQDAAQRLGQRGQLRARERLQPITEQAGRIQCVFVHVIRTSLCPCWHVYITL